MTGPQTARGRQVKGWMGEAQVKALISTEPDAPTVVLDLSPSMMGTDLAVLKQVAFADVKRWVLDRLVEVKTTQWRLLPSPIRQKVAQAAVRWAGVEMFHEVWHPDNDLNWEVRRVDLDSEGKVRTLSKRSTGFKATLTRSRAQTAPPPTVLEGGAVQ